jgi:hypothetical protein
MVDALAGREELLDGIDLVLQEIGCSDETG